MKKIVLIGVAPWIMQELRALLKLIYYGSEESRLAARRYESEFVVNNKKNLPVS